MYFYLSDCQVTFILCWTVDLDGETTVTATKTAPTTGNSSVHEINGTGGINVDGENSFFFHVNPSTAEWALRALIDFTLSNARRFYSSMGEPLGRERVKGSLQRCVVYRKIEE